MKAYDIVDVDTDSLMQPSPSLQPFRIRAMTLLKKFLFLNEHNTYITKYKFGVGGAVIAIFEYIIFKCLNTFITTFKHRFLLFSSRGNHNVEFHHLLCLS